MGDKWKDVRKRLDFLNLSKGFYEIDNVWGIPTIKKQDHEIGRIVQWGRKDRDGYGHFFMEDHQFERVWNTPKKYNNVMKDYDGIFSPDFSVVESHPLAVQLFNTYRNRWVGRYYQEQGVKVIPTITWNSEVSYEFAFEGVENGSTVVVSTVGIARDEKEMELFYDGYDLLQEIIKPVLVLVYTNVDVELYGNYIQLDAYAKTHLHKLDGRA
jgi:hypothetical protein